MGTIKDALCGRQDADPALQDSRKVAQALALTSANIGEYRMSTAVISLLIRLEFLEERFEFLEELLKERGQGAVDAGDNRGGIPE